MYEQKLVDQFVPSHWIGLDAEGKYRCLSWLALPSDRAICTTTGMQNHNFPVIVSGVLGMIGIFDVFERLQAYLRGEGSTSSRAELKQQIAYFERNFEMRSALSGGGRAQSTVKGAAAS